MKRLTLFWILIFVYHGFTQEKPTALKFDEFRFPRKQLLYYLDSYNYDYLYDPTENKYNYEKISFSNRVIRFAQELSKRKDSNAYIIFYNQRIGSYPLDKGKNESQEAARILANQTKYPPYYPNPKYPISSDRIITIDGGYRGEPTLEFWIVPANSEPPKPTPTFTPSEIAVCPEINVAGDGFKKDRKQPLKFSVAIKDQEPDAKLNLEWNVSAGKIVKGQNTNQIEVDLSETNDKFISAFVQVKGLHPECNNHKFTSTRVGSYPFKLDEFSHLYYSDMQIRLENLRAFLYDDPVSMGYIIIYGNRNENKKEVKILLDSLNKAMDFGKFDRTRIRIIDGGYREEMMVEIYLVPAGIEPPKPTPTLDAIFVVEPKKMVKKRKKVSK